MHSFQTGRTRSSTPVLDKFTIIPVLACSYPTIVGPLMDFASSPASTLESASEPGLINRLFWPAMAAISVVLAMGSRSRRGKLTFPFHIICLFAYLAFAGASILWAFSPEDSLVRFTQQVMIITSIVVPAMMAGRTADLMWGLFLCFALGAILNLFFIVGSPPPILEKSSGYTGYFSNKNYLGEFSAVACLLAFNEVSYPGLRRLLGILVLMLAALLVYLGNSKTALGLVLLVPILARLALLVRSITRISPAILLWSIVFCYAVLSRVSNFNSNRLSFMLYGDSTFTGRTVIWDFANLMMEARPLLGWGYQSFWWVGADGPSMSAPGWIKNMPNAHNGYYDTMLEMGYVGLALLLMFITATLHASGRVADRDPAHARVLLSLALYIVLYNFLESFWMRGFEFVWLMFVVVAAETGRYFQPTALQRAPYGSRVPMPGRGPGFAKQATHPMHRSPTSGRRP